ncbi:MAG: ABC transporter permease [Vulcanisaeta sp.]|jgi:peptide/nickel transport system permease protein|uniref:ABC transporter permease n=1 Tax=Vulcanisaeta sp. TaxID=2020871 RepID=UPI003D12F832
MRINRYIISGMALVIPFIIMALFADFIAPYSPTAMVGPPNHPPSAKYIMGTDNLGRDVFSRIVFGSRIILMVVFSAIALSGLVGTLLGLVSGYVGSRVDRVLSFIMDSIYAFPSLILAITLSVALGPSPLNAAVAIAVVYVPTYFRMIRGQVLSIKNEPFIEVARALGLPPMRILGGHILPHLTQTFMVVFSMNSADAVLTEAALSFLGLTVQPPTPDWGFDLYKGMGFVLNGAWWLLAFPGISITLLAMSFALLSEGVSAMYGGG